MKCVVYAADPPGCAQGVWDVDVLKYIMNATSYITIPESEMYVTLTQVGFPCLAGSTIKKWYIGARITKESGFPYVNLAVSNEVFYNNSEVRVILYKLTPYLNVYEYENTPPRMITSVNHIGLGNTGDGQIYYYRYGLGDFSDQPLISVDVGQTYFTCISLYACIKR